METSVVTRGSEGRAEAEAEAAAEREAVQAVEREEEERLAEEERLRVKARAAGTYQQRVDAADTMEELVAIAIEHDHAFGWASIVMAAKRNRRDPRGKPNPKPFWRTEDRCRKAALRRVRAHRESEA